MANVVDYVFNGMSRLGNDVAENTQRNQLNVKHANYNLKNHFNLDCAMSNLLILLQNNQMFFLKVQIRLDLMVVILMIILNSQY